MAYGCRTGPPAYAAWRAGTKPYAIVDFIPQSGTKNWASAVSSDSIWAFLDKNLALLPGCRLTPQLFHHVIGTSLADGVSTEAEV